MTQLRGMELSIAPYRLLFRHPFGTAHGTRAGTDALFIRLCRNGVTGYGEATLPPYLGHTVEDVMKAVQGIRPEQLEAQCQAAMTGVAEQPGWANDPATRAALITAYYDLLSREIDSSIGSYMEAISRVPAKAMVTLGSGPVDAIQAKLKDLPTTEILKVKLGTGHDRETMEQVLALDERKLFIDANQGWERVEQALEVIAMAGEDRIVGMEQPFPADRWDLHQALQDRTPVCVYGDESIQGLTDLERAPGSFGGVNIKLMKCGGLDMARRMAIRAKELGLRVMLGSMSESSLGSAAMAQLSGIAELADLDGPWLIKNDPFQGLGIVDGRMVPAGRIGIGVELKAGLLNWIQIGT